MGAAGAAACLLGLRPAHAAEECAARGDAAALVDRYARAVNAHDTSTFPELFSEGYIQHSPRSPSGLPAQVENFRRIFAVMPDVRMQVDDLIVGGDRVVARTTYSATHTQNLRGVPPTGKSFSFHTIDIWRLEQGKFAEHWDLTDTAEAINALR